MNLAAHLVYEAAGRPERDDFTAIAGDCWWCGFPSPTGRGKPLSALPDTFQDTAMARNPSGTVICAPCAWTIASGFRLPLGYARSRLATKAAQGRRIDLTMDGEDVKRLALVLADGRVGLWTTASGGREKAWQDAAKAGLADDPRTIGPCEYLGAWPLEALEPGVERIMNAFHHWVVDGVWTACTDGDKPAVRAHLLREDIRGPACTSLALAQGKHTLIHTPIEYPETGTRTVYALGVVQYNPADLARWLWAFESLRLVGASSEEIVSGDYSGRGGLAMLRARRAFEPMLDPLRGSRIMDLLTYLCRPWPAIQAEPPTEPNQGQTPIQEPNHGIDAHPAGGPPATRTDAALAPSPSPADRRVGTVEANGQLALW